MEKSDTGATDLNITAFEQFLERLNDSVRQNAGPDERTDEERERMLDQER